MGYFRPNKREILRIIKRNTIEKEYTDTNEVLDAVPRKWKLKGCGYGNIRKTLFELLRDGFIATAEKDGGFLLESNPFNENRRFFLAYKGEHELRPWLMKNWQIVVGFLVSLATIVIAIFNILNFFKK